MTQRKRVETVLTAEVGVTQRPWWNQSLIQTVLTGAFAIIAATVGWYLGKSNSTFDQNVNENANLTYMDEDLARFRFNSENSALADVMLPIHVNGGANTNVYFNRGNGFELISSSKGQAEFPVMISHLRCDATYFFRIDPALDGKPLKGTASNFRIPHCKTPDDRKSFTSDPHFVESFYMPQIRAAK
jgi:hypothetical protein